MGCDGQEGDSKGRTCCGFCRREDADDISDEQIICYLRTLYLILRSSVPVILFPFKNAGHFQKSGTSLLSV